MFGYRITSSTGCSTWLSETELARLDQLRSYRFLKVATQPSGVTAVPAALVIALTLSSASTRSTIGSGNAVRNCLASATAPWAMRPVTRRGIDAPICQDGRSGGFTELLARAEVSHDALIDWCFRHQVLVKRA